MTCQDNKQAASLLIAVLNYFIFSLTILNDTVPSKPQSAILVQKTDYMIPHKCLRGHKKSFYAVWTIHTETYIIIAQYISKRCIYLCIYRSVEVRQKSLLLPQ